MRHSFREGETAAQDAERALEDLAVQNLQTTTEERAAYIEEKFSEVASYVHGIAAQARLIYENPDQYPDREVPFPVKGSTLLAPQLLWSESLVSEVESTSPSDSVPHLSEEILKLGNLQDMLVQYNANNDMVSSTYTFRIITRHHGASGIRELQGQEKVRLFTRMSFVISMREATASCVQNLYIWEESWWR